MIKELVFEVSEDVDAFVESLMTLKEYHYVESDGAGDDFGGDEELV